MLTNYNIVKYSAKYFFICIFVAYIWNISSNLINQKSDIANLIGTALFTGLLIGVGLVFKSDVTKLVKNIKETKNKENE
jgi:TRAP-type C4-dicarboxylate transport system permease small subunit